MYSGDIYSCSVGNPFISDSETNHIINSHTHSGNLKNNQFLQFQKDSLRYLLLPEKPSVWLHFFMRLLSISLQFLLLHVYLPHDDASYLNCLYCSHSFISFFLLGGTCQVLLISRCSLGEPVWGPTSYFQRILLTADLVNPTPHCCFLWISLFMTV